ncbi:MAG TPA: MFS transporter [Xanthobacteraceae bacterium]|nr:MFS transporter [Xanthobacteraceae bacterium]
MPSAGNSAAGPSRGRLLKLLFLLFLAGVAMRMTILAMPPVIPLVHDELHMSETQVGLLIGLPLALFALAAVPGSLLIARIGPNLAVIAGMVIAAFASGARGAAIDVPTLYAAAIATGFGIAIMQPGMPTLVREWMPSHIALGTIAYSSGMLIGSTISSSLTIPFALPLLGGSWRRDLVFWAVPAFLIAPVFYLLSPKHHDGDTGQSAIGGRWWPDWKSPLTWLLGLALGCNNSSFFSTNAFLGEYLASLGKPALLGPALAWLNGLQLVAPILLLLTAKRFERRAWPFLLFGPLLLAAFLMLIFFPSRIGIIVSAALVGLTTAMTFAPVLALPALLSPPGDVPRTSAGMFTISYSCGIIIPAISGALWDLTGRPWTAFLPLCLCAAGVTVFGSMVTRYRAPARSDDHGSLPG